MRINCVIFLEDTRKLNKKGNTMQLRRYNKMTKEGDPVEKEIKKEKTKLKLSNYSENCDSKAKSPKSMFSKCIFASFLMISEFAVLCFEEFVFVHVHHFLFVRNHVYFDIVLRILQFLEHNRKDHLIGQLRDSVDCICELDGYVL